MLIWCIDNMWGDLPTAKQSTELNHVSSGSRLAWFGINKYIHASLLTELLRWTIQAFGMLCHVFWYLPVNMVYIPKNLN